MTRRAVYVWSPNAVTLKSVEETPTVLRLRFAEAPFNVDMSKRKYYNTVGAVTTKAKALVGKKIHYCTSQTTAAWSPSSWFCDVKEATT